MPHGITQPGGRLLEFLTASRRKVMVWITVRQVCRSTFWVSICFVPVMGLGRMAGLDTLFLWSALPLSALVVGAALAYTHVVQSRQVLRELDLACDRHDLITSGSEFLGTNEPFRRLALRKVEEWLDEHAREIGYLAKWPRETKYILPALLLMYGAWELSPMVYDHRAHLAATPPLVKATAKQPRAAKPPAKLALQPGLFSATSQPFIGTAPPALIGQNVGPAIVTDSRLLVDHDRSASGPSVDSATDHGNSDDSSDNHSSTDIAEGKNGQSAATDSAENSGSSTAATESQEHPTETPIKLPPVRPTAAQRAQNQDRENNGGQTANGENISPQDSGSSSVKGRRQLAPDDSTLSVTPPAGQAKPNHLLRKIMIPMVQLPAIKDLVTIPQMPLNKGRME